MAPTGVTGQGHDIWRVKVSEAGFQQLSVGEVGQVLEEQGTVVVDAPGPCRSLGVLVAGNHGGNKMKLCSINQSAN